MDAIELLKQDHATIQELFRDYQKLGAEAHSQKRRIVAEIIRELSVHAAMEEAALYPYMRAKGEGLAELVVEALEEHKVAKWEMAALERMEPGDERYDAKATVLIDSVRHHIQKEEREMLSKLRAVSTEDELQGLTDALKAARKAAPTHPHPRMPDEPPGNTLVTPVLAAVDRSLDRAADALEKGRDLARSALEGGRSLVQRLRRRMRDTQKRVTRMGSTMRRRAMRTTEQMKEDTMEAGSRARKAAMERREALRRDEGRAMREEGKAGRQGKKTSGRAAGKTGQQKKKTSGRAAGKTGQQRKKTSGRAAGKVTQRQERQERPEYEEVLGRW
jgi:hemerythrin-like domain-containing protein